MTTEWKLIVAFQYIDDDLISAAEQYLPIQHQKHIAFKPVIAVAACFCIIIATVLYISRSPNTEFPPVNSATLIDDPTTTQQPPAQQNLIIINDVETPPPPLSLYLDPQTHIPMSYDELVDYYGIDVISSIPDGLEELDPLWPRGLYGAWDMNYFVFGETDSEVKSIFVRVAKTTKFVKPMLDVYGDAAICSEIGGIKMYLFRTTFENETEVALFAYFEYNGCDIEVQVPDINSGCVNEDMFIGVLENLVTAQPK